MKNNKKMVITSTLLLTIILLGIGTIAYFRRTVNGNITGQTGNLVLIVNEVNAVTEETFMVSLNRSEEEPYVYPDDKGSFDINIDASGSSTDVALTINIERTNLPDNLKFYVNEEYGREFSDVTTILEYSNTMTKTITVYWFWDGSVDDENDSDYINQTLSANVSVSAKGIDPVYLYDVLKNENFTLDTNVDFHVYSSETNGVGLMMSDGTQNDEYPILYYRGAVTNNSVVYAGFCWLIVRTTETGGIKLIYNGTVNEDGSCNDNRTMSTPPTSNNKNGKVELLNSAFITDKPHIGRTVFNHDTASPVYVGYMYNDYDRYYSEDGILDADGYKLHLEDNSIDSESGRHIQNLRDSNVKDYVDYWYEYNIKNTMSEELLEDTVWCNDRSVISETYSIENMASGTKDNFYFAAYTRLRENVTSVTPSLVCARDIDKFTVDSSNGNGDLDYPIGLLTADEIFLAGFGYNKVYLSFDSFLSMTPARFYISGAQVFMREDNYLYGTSTGSDTKIHPSISLNNSTKVIGGFGTFLEPYIVG